MTSAGAPTAAADWEAARTHPHTYPGRHPVGAFVLVDGLVQLLTGPLDDVRLGAAPLDRVLADRGLPLLGDRYPVLAYGGNRNPATLALKLDHFGYRSPGRGTVLPVLTATLAGFDVVGAALSGQGYLYGDLVAAPGTELAVHVLLLDADQLRVMHDSEGVRSGFYDVGLIEVRLGEVRPGRVGAGGSVSASTAVTAMTYLARAPYFVSPTLGRPLAYAGVHATGRSLPEFDTVPMLAHALTSSGLMDEVADVVAPEAVDGLDVAGELMRFLNGQWWFRRHTGLPGLRAASALLRRIDAVLLSYSAPVSGGRDVALLAPDDAYRADPGRTLSGGR